MLPILSFIFMWFGALNWFFISAFQYDFVAGFFGTQSSLFSRIIYFIIGLAGFYFLFYVLKNKGKLTLFQNPFKKRAKPAEPIKVAVPTQEISPIEDDSQELEPAPKFSNIPAHEPKAQSGYKDFDVTKYDN